ncbi:MAG: LysE family transporter [Alphaproteobacteria bacterium]
MNPAPLIDGFILGFSLILAIGAQNSFVIRQGLARNHVLLSVGFCAVSDMLLIILGIAGMGLFAEKFFNAYYQWIFILAAIWIAFYGVSHLRNVFTSFVQGTQEYRPEQLAKKQTLVKLFVLTFVNPHVYLDTLVLIGIISLQYKGADVWGFGIGASLASLVFFISLGFGASAMSSLFNNKMAWRILDSIIAGIMFFISSKLIYQSGII